jgi:hypothetical protein
VAALTAVSSLLGGLVLAQLGWPRLAATLVVAGAVGALGLFAARGVWQTGRSVSHLFETATAELAERLAPELGTAPSSAVDFSRRLAGPETPYSRELALEHVERTARELEAADLTRRLEASRLERELRLRRALAAAAVVAVVALVGLGQGRRRLLATLVDPGAAQLVDVPLAADLRLTYHYPPYTGLPERVVESGDGSITAVVGTEVELWASADEEVRRALLVLDAADGAAATQTPMQVDGRRIGARFTVQKDGRYHFALVTRGGDKLEERQRHPVHAVPDAFPEVSLLTPAGDVELRDNQDVPIAYAAKDDFGVARVELVVEAPGQKEPKRLPVVGGDDTPTTREGSYTLRVAELGLEPGAEGRFYLEATDNDAISGPKKAVSASRRLVLFSAQKHHEDLVAREQHVLDALTDWLGEDLVAPYPATGTDSERQLALQQHVLEGVRRLASELDTVVPLLREDKLSGAAVAGAFANVREHVQRAEHERSQLILKLSSPTANRGFLHQSIAKEQERAITQTERDVVYLDDLLALERIDELKRTAKDLLASQRELQKLLAQYKDTQDPALREQLTRRIQALKQEMLGLLARMSEIKQQLPGEYRNLESASALAVDDQLQRLEQALSQGNLDDAARQLEQLADMIQNMSERLGKAEEQFGGERYSEVREQLAALAKDLDHLETEQQAVAKRASDLAKQLKDKTLERVGSRLDDFVAKARKKVADALKQLDGVQLPPSLLGLTEPLDQARQRLLDLDGLLQQKDFAESLRVAGDALKREGEVTMFLQARLGRYGSSAPEMERAADAAGQAERRTREVEELLRKLFPDAREVLSAEQLAEMRAAARKQAELEQQAGKVAEKMSELAREVPLFGGQPRASLDSARSEMAQASDDMTSGELPGGAQHGSRAADELGKLRQSLEQAARSGKGGIPMPLAMSSPGGGGDDGSGGQTGLRNEDVHIPDADRNRASPQFRRELLEAAKQKAPKRYEDAVRRYYEELIR